MRFLRIVRSWGAFAGALLLASLTIGGDCDGDIVDDPTFRDWCGATLCSWTLDTGAIAPVPTWNEDDLGVSFVEQPTQISQVTDTAWSGAPCILFTSVADVDPSAQMTLSLDFDNDGTIDYTTDIGATSWRRVQSVITAPAGYYGITFHIRKSGTGTATLAEMRIQTSTDCSAPAPDLNDLPIGDGCSAAAQCASGVCQNVFAGYSVCAQCSADVSCANGAACTNGDFGFAQCGPGQGLGAAGDPCVTSGDCESATCQKVALLPPAGVDAGPCDPTKPADQDNCSGFTVRSGLCR